MPAHNVVRIQGSMPGGEVWSVNPRYWSATTGSVVDFAELQTWANDIGAITQGLATNGDLRALMSTATSITAVRVEAVSASGTLVQAAEWRPATPVAGQGTATKPFQSSLVASLLTGRPGRSFRGRLYWPALNIAIGPATLRLTPTQTQSFASAMAAYLTAIGNAAPNGDPLDLVVVSQTLDVATPVTLITVGDVLDTQRRRRDSLEEQRSSQVVPYVPA